MAYASRAGREKMNDGGKVPAYRAENSPCYQEVIARDAVRAPDFCFDFSGEDVPDSTVPREAYTSSEYAMRELDEMWPRVWQFACREEQIAEAGDLVVYNSPGASLIVVRTESGDIRAYYNSCLHRGMKLCKKDTSVTRLACPFHNFAWSLDGELTHVPARWDFPNLNEAQMRLPEALVGRWGGFVFINRDLNAAPLQDYLGHVAKHFPERVFGGRQLTSIIRKTMRGNWKLGMDVFQEVFHIPGLHPQVLALAGDSATQYDVWPDDPHTSRFLEPTAVPSDEYPHPITEQEILDLTMTLAGVPDAVPLPEGETARHFLAAGARNAMSARDDCNYASESDALSNDGMQYTIFPNALIFRQLNQPWFYRFLPSRDDPGLSTFELFILAEKASDAEPPEVQIFELGIGQSYHDAVTDMFPPMLADVLDQDVGGIEGCQEGLRDGGSADLIFARYQEKRLRHFHQTLTKYLDGEL
jgi:phenylpropionate dioxygenase-like ring-hydroxylating dioxygenase large terminal subunit